MQVRQFGIVALATLGLGIGFGSVAVAGETVVTGANGNSATVETTRQRLDNGWTMNRNTTFPNGSTSQTTGTFTGDGNGGYAGSATRTNRQGQSNTYQLEGQRSVGNGIYQNNAIVTGPAGRQTTVNSNGTYGNGQFSGDRTVTFPDSKTRTTQIQGQRTGQGTYNGSVNVTGRNGRTRNGSFQRTR
jgi:hypothetical protein